MKVKSKTVKVSAKAFKKWPWAYIFNTTVRKGVKAKTPITYKKVKVNKQSSKFTVRPNGTIVVEKGVKKGTYKVTIKAQAASYGNYKAASKNFVVTVKVK